MGIGGGLTAAWEVFGDHVVERLGDVRQTVKAYFFGRERVRDPSVLVPHLVELRGDLAGELDSMLDGGVRLERFPLDLFQEIWAAAEELVMRELPRLGIGRSALGTRCLCGTSELSRVCHKGWSPRGLGRGETHSIDLVETVHVELPHKAGELAFHHIIIIRPARFGRRALRVDRGRLTLLCLKWEPRMLRLNSPTLETTKLEGGTRHET